MFPLDWIYPPKCIACRALLPLPLTNEWLCEACAPLFRPLAPPFCAVCGRPLAAEGLCGGCAGRRVYFGSHRAAFAYEDTVREIIHEVKYRYNKRMARGLGELAAGTLADIARGCDLIVPVPLHRSKLRKRGFNQSRVIALALSGRSGVPCAEPLVRLRRTRPQSELSPRGRILNVEGAFAARRGADVAGKKILLVDDIYTTGATYNACAEVLARLGASVGCASAAVAMPDDAKL
jgi:ComF family protein